jgi:hypothetical protein
MLSLTVFVILLFGYVVYIFERYARKEKREREKIESDRGGRSITDFL